MEKIRGYGYNDYELLYLINVGSEEALDIMFKKYEGLIVTTIKRFHVVSKMFEDFKQEGLMTLYKAIRYFREDKKMSFTNFFSLLLNRKYIDLLKSNEKDFYHQILVEDLDEILADKINEQTLNEEEYDCSKLSEFEKRVFVKIYLEKKTIIKTSEELNVKKEQIYTANSRIKNKLKK